MESSISSSLNASLYDSLNGRSTLRALEMHRQWKSSGPLSFADGPLSTFHAQAPSVSPTSATYDAILIYSTQDGKLEAPSSSGLSPSDVSAKDSDSGPFRLKVRSASSFDICDMSHKL